MLITKNKDQNIINTTVIASRGIAPTWQSIQQTTLSNNTLQDRFSRCFAPQNDSVFYCDTVSFSGKKRDKKKEAKRRAVEAREQTGCSTFSNRTPEEKAAIKKCQINKKLDKITNFLSIIQETPNNNLEKGQKNQLKQLNSGLEKLKNQIPKTETETLEKIVQIKQALENRKSLNINHHKEKEIPITAEVDLTYINTQNLKSTPNFSDNQLKEELYNRIPGIIVPRVAAKRIASLSTYLKEKMIGFEVPEYELQGEKKGGYQWFERGLENLLIGSKRANLKPEEYKKTAKELFGILSIHDNYWKSPEFIDYLSSLKTSNTITENQTKAVDATILAIKEINNSKKPTFGARETVVGYERAFTPMRFMPEIYEKCAYTGNKLNRESKEDELMPSADHIIPHSWGLLKNDDSNFFISSRESNSKRGNIPLIKYLKGYDGI